MKKHILFFLAATILLAPAAAFSRTANDDNAVEAYKSAAYFAGPDSPDYRKYAPDRDVQVMHVALDVTPDFKQRTIEARAVTQFKPISRDVRQVKFDAVDLDIRSVTSSDALKAWESTGEKLVVTFANPIPPDHEVTVTVTYHAEPVLGLYFRTPEMGYKDGDAHLFSQGEEIEARHWYPCFDSPNEKFTWEITCHVPDGMTVISNGHEVSAQRDGETGLVAHHWSQDTPSANYLMSLAAGYFKKLEDKLDNVPLEFYTLPSESAEAPNSFRDTKDIMSFYNDEIGVPFPWVKYSQVCVNDFVAGGMENTSATTLTDTTLFTDATENILSSQSLVAHEMAHQWFGDLVTCKEWSDIWLNEGFATYYAALYDGHRNGRDSMLFTLLTNARTIFAVAGDTNAIVHRNYDTAHELFGYLAYPKGGWVLHMLRSELGDDLYRRCIKTYLERNRYGSVVTEDLRKVIEELSGRSHDQFFDQWVYHAHYPELDASYSWDETAKMAKVTIRQTQKVSDNVALFNFPMTVRFRVKSRDVDKAITVKEKEEDFYFPLDGAPDIARLDPNYTILAKTTFNLPNAMLYAQLADGGDVIGRILAAEQLANKRDKATVGHLKEALNHDRFYAVRIEASRSLRMIHTDDALAALAGSTKQPDARVRREVADDLGGFYAEPAFAALNGLLQSEKNPIIEGSAIRGLAGYAKPEIHDLLLKNLNSTSYRNQLADAAIAGMRLQDDPSAIAPVLSLLSAHEADFTTRGFSQGLATLAYLDRNEQKKDEARNFLIKLTGSKNSLMRVAAINALAALGDPKAITVLQTFAASSRVAPEQAAAERAVAALRADRQPVDDFKNLRQEVLDLEKANHDLQKELDDVKKKLNGVSSRNTK